MTSRRDIAIAVLGPFVGTAIGAAILWGGWALLRPGAAEVRCSANVAGVGCSVQRSGGLGDAEVCWRARGRCANGVAFQADACELMPADAAVSRTVAADQVRGLERCDSVTALAVEGVRVR